MGNSGKKVLMLLDHPLIRDARVEKEAQSLIDQGYEITIVAVAQPDLPEEETRDGYHIVRKLTNQLHNPMRSGYREYIQKTAREFSTYEYDLLHCHDYNILPIGVEMKKLKPLIPLLYDAHEYLAGYRVYQGSSGWLNKMKGYLVWTWGKKQEKRHAKYVDALVTTTGSLVEFMRKRFRFKGPMNHIHNVPKLFDLSETRLYHQHFNLPESKKIIVHSGNIYFDDKGFDTYIQAVSQVDDLYAVIMANPKKASVYMEIVDKRNLKDRILFHPYVDTEEVGMYLSSADIGFVYVRDEWLSHWYASVNKTMEFSLAGLPIVSIRQPECVKIGDRYKHTIFYNKLTVGELTRAISEAINRQEELHQNALISRGDLSWDHEVKKLIDIYSQLLTNPQ